MRAFLLPLVFTAAVLAGCSDAPAGPAPHSRPDLQSMAFRLTMDLQAGKATVTRPPGASSRASRGEGPSLSLIGGEAVSVLAAGMTCTPKNPKQKRCTVELWVENKMGSVDLVTPTEFPRPPQGTNGVVLFPFSASSDGSGGWAEPSAEWDYGPANFFNDLGNCNNGSKTDCYRYELLPSPLRAATTEYPQVGFDVPADARNVTAYVVIAADLRENPIRTVLQPADYNLCGYVTSSGVVRVDSWEIQISESDPSNSLGERGFCSFPNFLPQLPVEILMARLRAFPSYYVTSPWGRTTFYAEYLDYGATLDAADYWLPSPPASEIVQSRCCDNAWVYADVTAAVQRFADQAQRPRLLQFRLMPPQSSQPDVTWLAGAAQTQYAPRLFVAYRLR